MVRLTFVLGIAVAALLGACTLAPAATPTPSSTPIGVTTLTATPTPLITIYGRERVLIAPPLFVSPLSESEPRFTSRGQAESVFLNHLQGLAQSERAKEYLRQYLDDRVAGFGSWWSGMNLVSIDHRESLSSPRTPIPGSEKGDDSFQASLSVSTIIGYLPYEDYKRYSYGQPHWAVATWRIRTNGEVVPYSGSFYRWDKLAGWVDMENAMKVEADIERLNQR